MLIVTDSTDIQQPKDIDTALFHLYSLFLNESEKENLVNRFKSPGMRYGDVKNDLFECFWTYFEPYRKKRNYLENHKDFVVNHLKKGAKEASEVAEVYIINARKAMGLNYEIADI